MFRIIPLSYLPSTFVFWLKYLSLYVFAPVMFLTTWLLSIFSSLVWELFPCTYHLVPNFIRVRSIYCFSELQKQLSLCFRRQDIVWCRPYITNSRLTLCNNVYVVLYCLCYTRFIFNICNVQQRIGIEKLKSSERNYDYVNFVGQNQVNELKILT